MSESWLIQVDVDDPEVDTVSGLLWDAGVLGVWEIDLGDGRTRLAGGADDRTARALADELTRRWPAEAYPAEHDGWLDSWRPYARPVSAGRFFLHPSWQEIEPPAGCVVVPLDAGRSFGQGGHATTRLMVEAIDDVTRGGERVLDVGCGSGVLSIVAALTGAAEVVGVDIEASALPTAEANAERNGVAARLRFSTAPVEEMARTEAPYDLVVANILPNVLRQLAEPIGKCVADDGLLLLSGILEHQVGGVAKAYAPLGLDVVDERRLDDWVALVLARPRPRSPARP